jgi:hypothetical protein
LLNRVDINDGPFLQIWHVLYFRFECSARSLIDFYMKQDGRAQAENMDQVLGLMHLFSDSHLPGSSGQVLARN